MAGFLSSAFCSQQRLSTCCEFTPSTWPSVQDQPWLQQSTRWRQHHCSHMLLQPPRAAATARVASADIVPHVCAAGQSTVDAPLTSWLPSGAHGARLRTTVEEVALTARRSLVPQEAAAARPAWVPRSIGSR